MLVEIPVSIGELFDKISILTIKSKYLKSQVQLENITKELSLLLKKVMDLGGLTIEGDRLYTNLLIVNEELWHIENEKRIHIKNNDFGLSFVVLARKVVEKNDYRALLKHSINVQYGSEIIEEKSHENTKL